MKAHLDIREVNGYSVRYTDVYPADALRPPIRCMLYIGLPDNSQFVGPQRPQALAEHIWRSKGPSGENKEYLFMLGRALRDLDRDSGDRHVEDLVRRVAGMEEVEGRREGRGMGGEGGETDVVEARFVEAIDTELTRVGITDEQEEVEKVHR